MENQQKQIASDEIDLGQVFAKIGDFFKSIGFAVVRLLALLRNTPMQNKRLFIVFILAGGALGFSYSSFLKKKFYDSSLILSSEYLNKRIVDSAIGKLNLLADEESSKGLATGLHISDSLAGNIVKFDFKPFVAERELIET